MPKQQRRRSKKNGDDDANDNVAVDDDDDDDDATNSNDLANEGSESSLETRKTYRHVRVNHGIKYRGTERDATEARCSCVPSAPLSRAAEAEPPAPHADAVRFLPRRIVASKVAAPHSTDCGDHCVNRAMLYECDPRTCPCGALCRNNVFRRRQYARVKTVRTPDKGIGLATAVPLKRGDFVIEYTGEIITESECVERMSASVGHAGQPQHFYYLAIDAGVAIDAGATGNPSRFINHSCDPNCETQKWHTRGAPVMGLFAKRDIAPGTELTFDYRWESIGDTQLPCRCGAKKCRGLLGSNKRLTNVAEERQRARLAAERARDASKREADQRHQRQLDAHYSSRVILSLGRLLLLAGTVGRAGGGAAVDKPHAVAHDALLRRALLGAFGLPPGASVADARACLDALLAEQRRVGARGPFLRRNVASRIATLTLIVDRLAAGLSLVPVARLRAPARAPGLPLSNLLANRRAAEAAAVNGRF